MSSFSSHIIFRSPDKPTYKVFCMNDGNLIGFTLNRSVKTAVLKSEIEKRINISSNEQTLFSLDGNVQSDEALLDPNFTYFLFFYNVVDDQATSSKNVQSRIADLKRDLKSYEDPTALASFVEKHFKLLLNLQRQRVDDQILLRDGWTVMVGLLESDVRKSLRKVDKLLQNIESINSEFSQLQQLNFPEVLQTLQRIKLPLELISMLSDSRYVDRGPNGQMSLYDWIAAKDTENRLENIVDDISDQLKTVNSSNLAAFKPDIQRLLELVSDEKFKNVVRLDERLTMMENKYSEHSNICSEALTLVSRTNKSTVFNNKPAFIKYFDVFSGQFLRFSECKDELLVILRKRYRTSFVRYKKEVRSFNDKVFAFDGLFNIVTNQLRVLRQIHEAPLLYMTAVSEVIRRRTLQKEFTCWLAAQDEKSSTFLKEENSLRVQFDAKLQKHFLRLLFSNMSDQMSNFVPDPAPFDTSLPEINPEYLHELRVEFPSMTDMLNVTIPNVFSRLTISSEKPTQSEATQSGIPVPTHTALTREESFFINAPTLNIDTMNRNFPPSHFPELEESSPCSLNLNYDYHSSPMPSGSEQPVFKLCSELEETLVPDMDGVGSLPMSIPNSSAMQSVFNTPEESFPKMAFTQQCASPKSYPRWIRKPSVTRFVENSETESIYKKKYEDQMKINDELSRIVRESLKTLSEEISETKKLCVSNDDDYAAYKERSVGEILSAIERANEQRQRDLDEHKALLEESNNEKSTLTEELRKNKIKYRDLEMDFNSLKEMSDRYEQGMVEAVAARCDISANYDRLKAEKIKVEDHLYNELRNLVVELKSAEDNRMRPLSPDEISEIVSRHVMTQSLNEGNNHQCSHADYEKACRTRMQFIVQGVEQKKDLEIAKVREEMSKEKAEVIAAMQSEIDCLKTRLRDCETDYAPLDIKAFEGGLKRALTHDELTAVVQEHMKNQKNMQRKSLGFANIQRIISEFEARKNAEVAKALENLSTKQAQFSLASVTDMSSSVVTGSSFSDFLSNKSMTESCVVVSRGNDVQSPPPESGTDKARDSVSSPADIDLLEIASCNTQTRIRLCDMKWMISLQDIHEGCSVMLFWDQPRNAYVVLTVHRTSYFIREGCMARFDADLISHRNWIFATVTRVDYCQIKKENNRYNLPINTRFYLVDVDPMPIRHISSTGPMNRQ